MLSNSPENLEEAITRIRQAISNGEDIVDPYLKDGWRELVMERLKKALSKIEEDNEFKKG
ncbi:hypothetical protein ACFL6I_21435 [candidate division KSB1 bacterium]